MNREEKNALSQQRILEAAGRVSQVRYGDDILALIAPEVAKNLSK